MLKSKNKIVNSFRILFLLLFLAAEFFGFENLLQAQSSCLYAIDWKEVKNTTTATTSQGLNFQATITESGSSSVCVKSANVVLLYQSGTNDLVGGNQPLTFANFKGSANFTLNTRDFPNQNILKLKARVETDDGNASQLTESSYWTVNITGAVSNPGAVSLSLDPNKGQFNGGDSVTIYASMNSGLYSQAQSQGVQNVYFNLLINGKSGYDETTLSLGNFSNQAAARYGTIDITSANGFQNGPNSITVELWSAGTSVKLGSSTVSLNAQALTNPGNQPGGTANPGNQPGGTTNPGNQPGGQTPVSTVPSDKLYNPLPADELTAMFILIVKGFLGIIAIWSVLFIIVGGFRMVVSAGNEEAIGAAKKTITWAVLGLVIAALSFSIIAIVQNLLGATIQ